MIREHNLGVREVVSLAVVSTTAKVVLSLPRMAAEVGATASWLVILISTIHGPLMYWSIRGLLVRYPGRSLLTATEEALGPVLGTVANLLYAALFFSLTTVVLRQFSDSLNLVFIPRTPLQAVVAILLIGVAYSAYIGVEGIARTTWLGAVWMAVGFAAMLLASLATHKEPNALAPWLGTGLLQVVMGGLSLNLLGELVIIGVIAPSLRTMKEFGQAFWWSIILSGLILVVTQIVFLYVFPYPAARRAILPVMQMSRSISLGPGVQRVESMFFLIWGAAGLLKMAATMYGTANSLAQALRLPVYRPLVGPLSLLMFSAALLPRNVTQAYYWDFALRQYGGLITVVLPAITWLVSSMRASGGASHATG